VEREAVLSHLHEERFKIARPPLFMRRCSMKGISLLIRTMYRLLEQRGESASAVISCFIRLTKARTGGAAPNQLWSWDINQTTRAPKWTYFYLYVILDVFNVTSPAGWSLIAKARSWPSD
jgi:hypothetical protein